MSRVVALVLKQLDVHGGSGCWRSRQCPVECRAAGTLAHEFPGSRVMADVLDYWRLRCTTLAGPQFAGTRPLVCEVIDVGPDDRI